ncbi:MAG TPA: peptidyl-prolyl cis-trans isomerase [Thermoanaerobaculia bacterium]|jgi:parvulin-like peptidyl-prolyl isomerase|nr:peptidyl-prolyl cis-trans isomerase [Thermoanaerobaculia bacterium]
MSRPRPFLPILFLALLSIPPALRAEVVNRVVLRINDQIATLYDYELRRSNMARELLRQPDLDQQERTKLLSEIGELAYKDLYEELLVESRAQQLDINIGDAEINQQMAQMKQNFGIQSDEEFAAALAQSGLSEAQLRERLRRDLRAREVMGREVQSRIKLDEDDLRRIYQRDRDQFKQPEQVQIREIVVLEEGGLPSAGERQQLAAQIRATVAGGKSLADAVAQTSGKGQTSGVIEVGWVTPGDLDPALEAAVWKLAPGAVSEPVAGRGGLHVMQVVDRKEARIPPFSEVQEQIRQREQRLKMQDEIGRYMAELEKKSLIVTEPPADAVNFRRQIGVRPKTQDEKLGLTPATDTTPNLSPDTPVGGEPGALPEPKPITNTVPPVVEEPPNEEAPPPPPPFR